MLEMWVSGAVPGFLENLIAVLRVSHSEVQTAHHVSSKAKGNSDSCKTQRMVKMRADELALSGLPGLNSCIQTCPKISPSSE